MTRSTNTHCHTRTLHGLYTFRIFTTFRIAIYYWKFKLKSILNGTAIHSRIHNLWKWKIVIFRSRSLSHFLSGSPQQYRNWLTTMNGTNLEMGKCVHLVVTQIHFWRKKCAIETSTDDFPFAIPMSCIRSFACVSVFHSIRPIPGQHRDDMSVCVHWHVLHFCQLPLWRHTVFTFWCRNLTRAWHARKGAG